MILKKDSILEVDCRLLYQYTNYNNIGLLQHILNYMMILIICFMIINL